ncbi:MAG: carbon-nitrogen family hydrolase, partial [Thermoanaerobaculia bacterium]|nr:carbon-nitrogen family hydrolase [Thermoanaerobaculia bacterium]
MKIAAFQSDIAWEEPQTNFERLESWIGRAKDQGAELLALPEMFACGFSMATERVAEPVDGPSTRFLIEGARRHGLWLAGSVPERAEGDARPANTLILAGPDGTVHRYRKIHPFSYAGEDEHYVAGTERITVEIGGVRITPFVCYDLRFADEFWAEAANTDLYLVVANWPETRARHWIALLQARAIENQAFVAGVNRVGTGGKLSYSGDSRILDPMGDLIVAASGQETLLVADVDP